MIRVTNRHNEITIGINLFQKLVLLVFRVHLRIYLYKIMQKPFLCTVGEYVN